jgi:hypothetical protein
VDECGPGRQQPVDGLHGLTDPVETRREGWNRDVRAGGPQGPEGMLPKSPESHEKESSR